MGKRTTTRHKEDNTFRFQGQKEKERNIVVNQLGTIRDWIREDDDDEATSYLYKAMTYWQDLNQYQEFQDVLNDIGDDVKTLHQVIHEQQRIFDILIAKVDAGSAGILQAVYGLLTAFVSDVRLEYEKFLPATLKKITEVLLSSTNTELVSISVDCYGRLLKELKGTVVKDFGLYLKIFSRVLRPKVKPFIIKCVVKAFAFIASKVCRSAKSVFLKRCLKLLSVNKHAEDGLALLLLTLTTSELVVQQCLSVSDIIDFKDCSLENVSHMELWEQLVLNYFRQLFASKPTAWTKKLPLDKLCLELKASCLNGLLADRFDFAVKIVVGLLGGSTSSVLPNTLVVQAANSLCEIFDKIQGDQGWKSSATSRKAVLEIVFQLQRNASNMPQIMSLLNGIIDHCDSTELVIIDSFFRSTPKCQEVTQMLSRVYDQRPEKEYYTWLSSVILGNDTGLIKPQLRHSEGFTGASIPCQYYRNGGRAVKYASDVQVKELSALEKLRDWATLEKLEVEELVEYQKKLVLFLQIKIPQENFIVQILEHLQNYEPSFFSDSTWSIVYLMVEILLRNGVPTQSSETLYKAVASLVTLCKQRCTYRDTDADAKFSPWSLKTLDLLLWFARTKMTADSRQKVAELISSESILNHVAPNLACPVKTVRGLSLSIVRTSIELKQDRTENEGKLLHFFSLAMENELEEFNVTNMNHLDAYLKMERYIRDMALEEADSGIHLELIMQYLCSLLFQNNDTIMKKARDTLFPVLIQKVGEEKFWLAIRSRFLELNNTGTRPPVFRTSEEFDFNERLRETFFGYSSPLIADKNDKADYTRLISNLWILFRHIHHALPGQGQKEVLACIYKIFRRVKSEKPFHGIRDDGDSKKDLEILKAALDVLLPICKSGYHDHRECRDMTLVLLQAPKQVNEAATKVLRRMSPTIEQYLAKIEKLGESSHFKSAHLKSYSGDDAFFLPEDETIFIDYIVRSLLGLKANNNSSLNYIVAFLQRFSESQAERVTQLLTGDIEDWKRLELNPGHLKYMTGLMRSIFKMIVEWRYIFPNLVQNLVLRVCELASVVQQHQKQRETSPNADETASITDDVANKRSKAVISAARVCIIQFFDLFSQQPIDEKMLNMVFTTFIWDQEAESITPSNYSTDSISWLLKLMMVWSSVPRYHLLFVKCKTVSETCVPAYSLFNILESPSLKSKPRAFGMTIVNNLATVDAMEVEDEIEPLLVGDCLPLDQVDGEPTGVSILRTYKDRLLRIITSDEFIVDKAFIAEVDTYVSFLKTCLSFCDTTETTLKLCVKILALARKFRNRTAELVSIYELVESITRNLSQTTEIVQSLSGCLSWTVGKGPREALCNAISACMTNKNHARVILDLNSYQDKVTDTPDFGRRQKAFEKSMNVVTTSNKFKAVLFRMLCNTCFFYMNNELDIGLLSAVETLMSAIAGKLQDLVSSGEHLSQIKEFIDKSIIPELKRGIRSKDAEIFTAHLKVSSIFARYCHSLHGTLNGVYAVFFNQEGRDVLLEFADIKLSTKAKAANYFETVKAIMRNHPSVAADFAIPILSHNLNDVEKLKHSMTNMIQCCLDGIKNCVLSLPHGAYFKYLEEVLEAAPQQESLQKQYHRHLSVILDAFHYKLDPTFVETLGQHQQNQHQVPNGTRDTGEAVDSGSSDNGSVLLTFDESKSLMTTIEKKFIPKLRKYLHLEEKASHKLAKISLGESELVRKIPTTLAYVKLLHKLPDKVRRNHMVWVIPTLCSSLNSKLYSVRCNVRSTLIDVTKELGPRIFRDIVKYMKAALARGYQKHVRNYTVIYLLKQVREAFDADPNSVPVTDLLPIVEDEMFGATSEEKDVKQILAKTPEAKGQNGVQLLHYCALYVDEQRISKLLECPLEKAKTATTLKTIQLAKTWVTEVANGLAANQQLSSSSVLTFLREFQNTHVVSHAEKTATETAPSKYLTSIVDSQLLPQKKKVSGQQTKLSGPLVSATFVYNALYSMLKKETFENSPEVLQLLNSFASEIVTTSNDQLLEVRTPTLRSLILMFQYPLKCFSDNAFVINMWRKYFLAVNDAVSNEDVNMYYKFLTTFCLTFPDFRMELADFNLLIKCMYRHLQENKCTGSALVLLRHILQKSLKSDDLLNLIREVKRRICSDDSVHVQEGCRAAYIVYMKNYLKSKSDYMEELYYFFKVAGHRKSQQDTYSVFHMIGTCLAAIPESWISTSSVNITVDLMLALMKSEDPETQKIICNVCMKNLFDRMSLKEANDLMTELDTTVSDANMIPYQREICLTLSKIIELNKCWDNAAVMGKVSSMLTTILRPTPFLDLSQKNATLKPRHREFALYEGILACHNAAQCLKIMKKPGSYNSQGLLQLYEWIRTEYLDTDHDAIQDASIKCWNTVMSERLENHGSPSVFDSVLQSDDVVLDLLKKYMKAAATLELADMKTKAFQGLKLLAKLTATVSSTEEFHLKIGKLLQVTVNSEVAKSHTDTKKRETAFTFMEEYVRSVPIDVLPINLRVIMALTTRERTDENMMTVSEDVVNLCTRIQQYIETRLGGPQFLQVFESARKGLQEKRDNAKAKKKQSKVLMNMGIGATATRRKRPKTTEEMLGVSNFKKRKVVRS